MRFAAAYLTGAALAAATPVLAHHSFSMFDNTKMVMLEGTVKEFEYVNPHAWIYLNVPDASGRPAEWAIEMGGINALTRAGWRADTIKPGDKLQVQVHPLKDGSRGGQYLSAKLPDGRAMEGGDLGLPPIAR